MRIILIVIFFISFAFPATSQVIRNIDFYYTLDKQVYQGVLNTKYSLFYENNLIEIPEFIDYELYDYEKLNLEIKIQSVRFARTDHNERIKIIIGSDNIDISDGLTKTTSSDKNIYFRSSYKPTAFTFQFEDVETATPSLAAFAFFIADIEASYAEMLESDSLKFGFGAWLESYTIVPKFSLEDESDISSGSLIVRILLEGLNETFGELSYEGAHLLKAEKYTAFESKISEGSKKLNELPYANKGASVTPKTDYDKIAFQNAVSENTIFSYQGYINEYPSGKYTSDARRKIVNLTPFVIEVTHSLEEIYKVHNIRFIQGVGGSFPKTIISDNGDWAIKTEWLDSKNVAIKIPQGRSTQVRFQLGSKDTTLVLSNEEEVIQDIEFTDTSSVEPNSTIKNNSTLLDTVPEEASKDTSKRYMAILLALPFMLTIGILLYRKHQLEIHE